MPALPKTTRPKPNKAYLAWVAQKPCLVSRRPATVHHVTGYSDRPGRITRDDTLVVPLAPEYHLIQFGPHESVEALGHQGFYKLHGIDLLWEAQRLWMEYMDA